MPATEVVTRIDSDLAIGSDVDALVAEVRPGERVAILSNGGFGGIHDKLLRALEAAART